MAGFGGFAGPAGAAFNADFQTPAGSANIGLPNVPVPKKKKKAVAPVPVTPLPQIVPPTPVQESTSAFQDTLAAILENFATKTAAIAAPPTPGPSLPVPPTPGTALALEPAPTPAAPTLLGGPTPPAVPKRVPAQGVTPADAVNRQKRRAGGASKARTILTSGRGLLDLQADESRRARKTLLGA